MPFKWCLNRGLVFSIGLTSFLKGSMLFGKRSYAFWKKVVCFWRKGSMLFGKGSYALFWDELR